MTGLRFDSKREWRGARRSGILALSIGLSIGLSMAYSAAAGDGVVEINQASALAGGGFPVTLSATGSYALTSNLTVPDTTDAIVVTGIDVFLDLNGFSILGPSGCSTTPPPVGTGSGVVSNARGTTVANGSVRGFGARGLSLGAEGRVVDVRVRCAGIAGIRVGSEGRVERSAVRFARVGVETGPTSLLIDDEITSNEGFALDLGAGSALRGNVLVGNNGSNANPQIQAGGPFFELGPNRCGDGLTCSAGGVCGNGQVEAVESCDDANTVAGDGCDAVCQVEAGFVCAGQPSACTSACGDGVIAVGEQCDGANLNGQTCSTFGFDSGLLSCTASCQVDTSSCSFNN